MNCSVLARRQILSSTARSHRGTVLVATLVCLLVVMGILGAMVQGALRAQKQLHRERDFRQTEFLLQAGSDRANYRLANDANYQGETWNLPADSIADRGEGRVTIQIVAGSGEAVRKAQIMAEYPVGGETSIRRSRIFQIPAHTPQIQE